MISWTAGDRSRAEENTCVGLIRPTSLRSHAPFHERCVCVFEAKTGKSEVLACISFRVDDQLSVDAICCSVAPTTSVPF
jgi:hypothetical protein